MLVFIMLGLAKTHAERSNYANSINTHKKDFISNKQCANSKNTED